MQMQKAMEGEPYKRPYRKVMRWLIPTIMFCAMLPYIAPSILMGDIMQTYGVDLSLAGLGMTAQLVMAGVCFFIGSFIIDKIGMLKSCKLAITALLVGVVISALAPNIYIFIFARLIAGFGQGLAVGLTGFSNTWFAGKELSMAITINTMSSAISLALSSALSRPLANAFGSWKGAMWVYAAFTAVCAVLWYLFGKSSPEGEAQEKERAAQAAVSGKTQSSLSMALKEPQFWKLFVYVGLYTVIDTARATFLPTYMAQVKEVPQALVGTATSLLSLLGLAGTLLGGVLVNKIPYRKTLMFIGSASYMVCGLALTFVKSNILCVVLCTLLGFIYFLPIVAQSTLVIETAVSKGKPAMISGAMAMCTGTGMMLTLTVSPIFQSLVSSSSGGMTTAFRVFFGAMIIVFGVVFTFKETGKKPEAQPAAATAGE